MEEINNIDDISPLFVVEAEKLLSSGKPKEAANLCMRGLEKYPSYDSAHSILIKAFKELNRDEQAEDILNDAPVSVKRKLSISELNSKLAEEKEGTATDSENKGNEQGIVVEPDDSENTVVEPDSQSKPKTDNSDIENDNNPAEIDDVENKDIELPEKEYHEAIKNDSLSDDLIENLPGRKGDSVGDIEDTLTLAKIYEAQDAWSEALKIYEKFLEKNPDRREEFKDKLTELNTLVEDENE